MLGRGAQTSPEPKQSAAHRRGRPTRGKRPTGHIRIANVGERPGPTHHTLDSQRASIERTARNNGNEIVDVLRDQDQVCQQPQPAADRPLQRSGFSLATRTRSPGPREGRARTATTPIPAAWSTATADVDGTSWSPTRNHPPKRSPRSAALSTPPGERSVAIAIAALPSGPRRKQSSRCPTPRDRIPSVAITPRSAGVVIAFVTERSCRRCAWLLLLGGCRLRSATRASRS